MSQQHIVLLPGDGIGPEIIAPTRRLLELVAARGGHEFSFTEHLIGGAAIDATGEPLPATAVDDCRSADAVLLGAVGGPKWSDPNASVRPEQGLLALRKALNVFANLRPVKPEPALFAQSPLKDDRLQGVDLLVVRELTGGTYFGDKVEGDDSSDAWASDACVYHRHEIERVVRMAGELARSRRGKLTLVDKANVMATSRLWRRVTQELIAAEFGDLAFDIELVDAAAMHLLGNPARFDVIVTENLFGDILTDEASMLAGSLGLLPSASLGADGPGLYEPIHGSAPDIAGQSKANPFATFLSAAMMLELSLNLSAEAQWIRDAISACLKAGQTTGDIGGSLSTNQAAEAVFAQIKLAAAA